MPTTRDLAAQALEDALKTATKIYVFCNGCSHQWHSATALSEEGLFLGGHICSDHGFIPGDMGVDGANDWANKRALYAAAYPDGFEVILSSAKSAEVEAAYAKHTTYDKDAYKARMDAINAAHELAKNGAPHDDTP